MLMNIYKLLLVIFILSVFSTSAYGSSDWKITLKVSGEGTYDYCIAGVKVEATDGHDNAWDIPSPPGSLNNTYIYIYFPHTEWGDVFDRFRQDIKAPDLPKEWTFEVDSNIAGEVTITWPDIKNVIPDKDAVLVDVDGGGWEVDMQTSPSFVFGNTGFPRRFLMRISEGIHVPNPPESLVGNLIKKDGTKNAVQLYWKQNSELDLAGYNIYRSTTPGSGYQRINYSLIQVSTYEDEQVVDGNRYYYVVTAVNTVGGESGYSNEVEVYVPPAIATPNPPQGLTAKYLRSEVRLSWKRNLELDLAGYNVYRSTTSGSGYQKINGSLISKNKPQYVDKQTIKGSTYYYVVTAVNKSGGESGYSNEVKVIIYYK